MSNFLLKAAVMAPTVFGGPLLGPLAGVLLSRVLEKEASDGKDVAQATEDTLKILEKRASVIRELAIARRIDCAEKVSIEEYYDTKGEGAAGLKAEEEKVTIGLSGAGARVVKRVYTLEGWRSPENIDEGLMSLFQEIDVDKDKSVING